MPASDRDRPAPALYRTTPEPTRQKITFAEMRAAGVRGLLIYCNDYHCSHWTAISGDQWPDDVRLSDLEPRFTCQACGRRGADVRPNFHWEVQRLRQPFPHYLRSLAYDQRTYAFSVTMVVGSVLEPGLPAHVAS
jgi:hypothetical protein